MAPILNATLPLFVEDAARRPFRYGVHDCALFVANWGRVVTGIDGAAHHRGRYKSAVGCARMIARAGSLAALVSDCARAIGFVDTLEDARGGDVGVIVARTQAGVDQVAAIRFDETRWAFLSTAGVHVGGETAHVVCAWGAR